MTQPGLLPGDRYRLAGRIAAGGMGEVWRATDLVLGRPVAVKLLRPGCAGSAKDRARFRGEARHAGALSHAGIARVYDYREADPPYLVMELVEGPSLARVLDEGPVGPARTMGLIAQAARALQAAHAAGLVHRDIKPGNLLISRDGHVKITDFGIAHVAGAASVTGPGMLIGTPAYLAPERAAGAAATPAADLYALGIVAYQCLTGRLPFEGEPLAVAIAHMDQPLPAHVPAGVAALVADLTAKDPRARPASAGQVAERAERLRDALTGAAAGSPPGRHGQASARRGGKPGRRVLAGLSAVLVIAVIAVIAAAGWGIAGDHGPRSAPPSATQGSGPPASHPTHRAAPASRAGGATSAPRQVDRSVTSGSPSASAAAATPAPSPTPTRTPSPSDTPSPSSTPSSSSGTPSPSGSPSPSGTPSSSGTSSSSGVPTQTGTPTAAPSTSPSPA